MNSLIDIFITAINNNSSKDKISVYTAACNTKDRLWVAYDSLKNQTHKNWEWSIYDDSSDNYTWEVVKELAKIGSQNHNQ
jgi:glycosyltransferase involved in cell wall biosynthesis